MRPAMFHRPSYYLVGLVLVLVASTAVGQPTAHTTFSSFSAATAGPSFGTTTLDFETQPTGSIPNGGSVGGVSLSLTPDQSPPGTLLSVNNTFSTVSGSRYLGSSAAGNSGLLVAGDTVTFSFGSGVRGLGLYFVTADTVFAGDAKLTLSNVNGSFTALNSATPDLPTLTDGGKAYFVGAANPTDLYTGATLTFDSAAAGAFLFTLDDVTIVSPVPEPSSLAFAVLSALALFGCRRLRRAA